MQRGYIQRQWDRPGAQYSCYALMHSRNWCSGQFWKLFVCDCRNRSFVFYLLFRPLARKVKPITGREESKKLYRLSITCRKTMKTDLRALLINANTCKTLYLNHLGSEAFIGDKVEVVAKYCSVGSPKIMPWKGLCARL